MTCDRALRLRSPLVPIFLTIFVDILALTMMLPLLPYYAKHFGADDVVAAALTTVFAVCQLVSGPILGRASDRRGRKPVLLFSQVFTCVALLVLAGAQSLTMVFASRVIAGLTAGNLTVAQAYISDVTKPEERTKSFGLLGISFGVGFVIGPAMSGALAKAYGYATPALVAAALSALSIVTTLALLPRNPPRPTLEGAPPPRQAVRGNPLVVYLKDPATRPVLLAFGGFLFSFATLLGGLALFLRARFGFDVQQTSFVYGWSGVVGALVQPALGPLSRRFGEAALVRAGLLLDLLGFAALGFVEPGVTLYASVTVTSVGSAFIRPAATTLLTQAVPQTEQGAVLGASQLVMSLSQILGPLIAGALVEKALYVPYGFASAGFAALGLLAALSLEGPPRAGEGTPRENPLPPPERRAEDT